MVVATAVWGQYWTGQHVCFHSDNMGVVSVLQSRTAETEFQMHLLRCFPLYCSIFKFSYSAVHIPGSQNTAADALSRNDLTTFLSLVPQTPQVVIPQAILNLLVCNKSTCMGLSRLDHTVQSLINRGLSTTTLATYESGKRKYQSFCRQFHLAPLPVSESTLCRFVLFLFSSHLQ